MYVNKKRVLENFIELVKIYSPPGGESQLSQFIQDELSMIGLPVKVDGYGNIICKIPATDNVKAVPIMFSSHLDVVEPCKNVKPIIEETEDNVTIRTNGDTVLGADDKAGISMIFEALNCLIDNNIPHGEIEIIFTLEEETGLLGAKAINTDHLGSKMGFILDHSEPVGIVINKAPQHENLEFMFKGRASHAGLKPENGINAILMASKAIQNMPIGRLDDFTTANIGTINGGIANNIVPDECKLSCEVRSHDIKRLNHYVDKYISAVNKVIKENHGTSVEVLRETEYKNYLINSDHEIIKVAQKAASRIGIEFGLHSTNGGSDANVFNHKGIPTVCLGCGYNDPHATSEWITLKDLCLGAEYVISIIQSAITSK